MTLSAILGLGLASLGAWFLWPSVSSASTSSPDSSGGKGADDAAGDPAWEWEWGGLMVTTPGPAERLYAVKTGASLDGLQPVMLSALDTAAALWREYGDELVVTSGTDGSHPGGAGAFHPRGLAVDLRTRGLSTRQIKARADELLRRLGAGYDVIIERDHLHVERDGQTHVAVNFHPPSLASAFA